MATKIGKNTYFLWIDPAGGTNYKLVVCLNNFSFNGTTAVNDASSMCGPDSSPGDISSSISLDAQFMINEDDNTEVAAADAFSLWQDSTTFGWRIGRAAADIISGDVTKTGSGYFSAYTETHTKDGVSGFTGTITVAGEVTQTIEAGES